MHCCARHNLLIHDCLLVASIKAKATGARVEPSTAAGTITVQIELDVCNKLYQPLPFSKHGAGGSGPQAVPMNMGTMLQVLHLVPVLKSTEPASAGSFLLPEFGARAAIYQQQSASGLAFEQAFESPQPHGTCLVARWPTEMRLH